MKVKSLVADYVQGVQGVFANLGAKVKVGVDVVGWFLNGVFVQIRVPKEIPTPGRLSFFSVPYKTLQFSSPIVVIYS